jgi:acyl-CoA reductase-like NAD-dependent aldehyde dehydrogenase
VAGAVHVVGAGTAGLAAALRLARLGHVVTLREAAPDAGGRCRALPDGTDNGTHALTGANTAALAFLREIGAQHGWVEPEPGALPVFDLRDGTERRVALSPLGWRRTAERPKGLSIGALWALSTARWSVGAALRRHPEFLRSFVEPLTVAALNTPVEEASAPLLRRVLTRLLAPGAARVLVAREGLRPDLIDPALAALKRAGVAVHFGDRLRGIEVAGGRVHALELSSQRLLLGPGDAVVLALPPWEAARLIPGLPVPEAHAPILNIHYTCASQGPVRFFGLLGGLAQWVLVRPSGVSVTVSAADAVIGDVAEVLGAQVWPEVRRAAARLGLAREWPEAVPAFRVVKERRATPRHGVVPNPVPPRMPMANVALAGDWTWPGLPATIDAAVLSGVAAALALHNAGASAPRQNDRAGAAVASSCRGSAVGHDESTITTLDNQATPMMVHGGDATVPLDTGASGIDALSLATRARREGGDDTLDGTRQPISTSAAIGDGDAPSPFDNAATSAVATRGGAASAAIHRAEAASPFHEGDAAVREDEATTAVAGISARAVGLDPNPAVDALHGNTLPALRPLGGTPEHGIGPAEARHGTLPAALTNSATSMPAQALAALREQTGTPSIAERHAMLDRLHAVMIRRAEEIAAALDADYSGRSRIETMLADVLLVADCARHARRHLARWARPRRHPMPFPFQPAGARVECVPKGVIGIMAPWNYPFQLALLPAIDALAAGNRVVIKPSELLPRSATLLAEILAEAPGPGFARVVQGGPDVAADFAAQPWDHLVFTGGTETGGRVMRAAAQNLTPLTLELGGKCSVLVLPGADLGRAAREILAGKAINAGQTCIAPDTVLLIGHSRTDFTAACRATGIAVPETALASEAQAARIARFAEGARLTPLGADVSPRRRSIALAEAPDHHPLLREEVFGPILPVVEAVDLAAALAWINTRPTPLAIYLFGATRHEEAAIAAGTRSGAIVSGRCVEQAAIPGLDLGGIGQSGFGRYRGEAGFRELSNQRVRMWRGRWSLSRLFDEPRGAWAEKIISRLLRR